MFAIEARSLRKQFGTFVAVRGVDLEIPEGASFGMLGPNGAGKSTLIRLLTTLLLPSSGTARVAGHDVQRNPSAVRKSIGVIPQASTSDPDLTAAENMNFYAGLCDLPYRDRRKRIDDLLASVGLLEWRDKRVGTFSGGMRRRLEIARSLLQQPKVLFLDEPTLGLDPAGRLAMGDMIRRLQSQGDLTVFLTTHYLEEADQLCSRIAIFDRGEVVAMDTPANLKASLPVTHSIETSFHSAPVDWPEILSKLSAVEGVEIQNGFCRIESRNTMATVADLLQVSRTYSVGVGSLVVKKTSLEDVYVHYTGRGLRDSADGANRLDVRYLYDRSMPR